MLPSRVPVTKYIAIYNPETGMEEKVIFQLGAHDIIAGLIGFKIDFIPYLAVATRNLKDYSEIKLFGDLFSDPITSFISGYYSCGVLHYYEGFLYLASKSDKAILELDVTNFPFTPTS